MNQSLSLQDDLVRMIEAKVETGEYASASEVVRDALGLLTHHDRNQAEKLAWLQQAWRDGVSTDDVGEFDRESFRKEAHLRLARSS